MLCRIFGVILIKIKLLQNQAKVLSSFIKKGYNSSNLLHFPRYMYTCTYSVYHSLISSTTSTTIVPVASSDKTYKYVYISSLLPLPNASPSINTHSLTVILLKHQTLSLSLSLILTRSSFSASSSSTLFSRTCFASSQFCAVP